MNSKKIEITIPIDRELKERFESKMKEHGKTYDDALETGMIEILREVYDSISHRLKELDEERDRLLKLKAEFENNDRILIKK